MSLTDLEIAKKLLSLKPVAEIYQKSGKPTFLPRRLLLENGLTADILETFHIALYPKYRKIIDHDGTNGMDGWDVEWWKLEKVIKDLTPPKVKISWDRWYSLIVSTIALLIAIGSLFFNWYASHRNFGVWFFQ